jgi:hypothetical protein
MGATPDVTVVAVPSEPLIPGKYRKRTIDRAKKFGFPMYRPAHERELVHSFAA